jgi:hypothetical protein
MNAAGDAGQRDLMMQLGGGRDGDGIDAGVEQLIKVREHRAADHLDGTGAVLGQGIDDADEFDARQASHDATVVGAHHAGADDAHPQHAIRAHALRARR